MESTKKNIDWKTVAEVELIYRNVVKPSQMPMVTDSKQVYSLLTSNWDEDKIEFVEQFKILLLNTANKVLGIFEVSTGGIAGTVADPKLIFMAALRANASAIILSHNHPSGNLQPSQQDLTLTRKITEGGKILDIRVLDHLIITTEGYYSFADEGVL
jgi:DNA repair protein RadC